MIILKDPLVLIIGVPLFMVWFFFVRPRHRDPGFRFPSDEPLSNFAVTMKQRLVRVPFYLRVVAILLVAIALARPQFSREVKTQKDALAVMMAIDCSSTMLAEDLSLGPMGISPLVDASGVAKRPNRLQAVVGVARDFIQRRNDDLIGLIAFAAEAYVVCPPTFDHVWLLGSLDRVKVGLIKDGTAIGSAILSALNALKDLEVRSSVIILLSDGINNAGKVPPLIAAKSARSMGVKIYTIGIASRGQTPYPTKDTMGRTTYKDVRIDINEDVLRAIAQDTGGQYFRADTMESLRESYREIDRLERQRLEERRYVEYDDLFPLLVTIACILLIVELILSTVVLRKIP